MSLPEGVQAVTKPSGKTYYYWAPKRGTARPGERVALGSDPFAPEFTRRLAAATGALPVVIAGAPGTFAALILAYRASPEWDRLRPTSQRDYAIYLDRLELEAGDRMVAAMTAQDVIAMRNAMKATPHAANHMVSILRTLLGRAIEWDFRRDNPAVSIKPIKTDDNGARPWPEEGYAFVLAHAPTILRRMAFLGRATGQRAGDLVRMRPADLDADGIAVRIGKLREQRHFVPLTSAQMTEILSWGVADLDLFIKSPAGNKMTAHYLAEVWARWRKSDEAKPIAHLTMTIHGLRATAVVDRQLMGTEDNGIAAELGMSVQMVTRYSRFADKTAKARASRDRREAAQVLKFGKVK